MKNINHFFLKSILISFTLLVFCHLSYANQGSMTDDKIIKIVMTIDENEIAAAGKILNAPNLNKDVLNYAQFLKDQHSQNLDDAKQLASKINLNPTKSDISNSLEKEGKSLGNKLSKENGKNLEMTYINAMIKGHEDALHLLNKLIKESKNTELTQFLKATAVHVQDHLNKAKSIKHNL